MKNEDRDGVMARRNFLKGAGIGLSAAGAALAVGAGEAVAAPDSGAETGGYRESEHVRRYYALARS